MQGAASSVMKICSFITFFFFATISKYNFYSGFCSFISVVCFLLIAALFIMEKPSLTVLATASIN
jgi:hypothetical protein